MTATRPSGPAVVGRRDPAFRKIDYLQIIAGFVTAPGATLTPITAAETGILTIRNYRSGGECRMFRTWTRNTVAGDAQMKGFDFHDNVNGTYWRALANRPYNVFSKGTSQFLSSGATPAISLSGVTTSGKIETWASLIGFINAGAPAGQWIDPIQAKKLRTKMVNVRAVITTAVTGSWSAGVALNASGNICNLDSKGVYVFAGFRTDTECAALALKGPDFPIGFVGGPGNLTDPTIGENWFPDLSMEFRIGAMPVMMGSNVGLTNAYALSDDVSATIKADFLFWQIGKLPG